MSSWCMDCQSDHSNRNCPRRQLTPEEAVQQYKNDLSIWIYYNFLDSHPDIDAILRHIKEG